MSRPRTAREPRPPWATHHAAAPAGYPVAMLSQAALFQVVERWAAIVGPLDDHGLAVEPQRAAGVGVLQSII